MLARLIVTLHWSSIQATAFRLQPGGDLKTELAKLALDNRLRAAAVISAVGSLSEVSIRLANGSKPTEYPGKHEIISLAGTLSQNGIHLHMSVANTKGQIFGGHVIEGSRIFTTAEVVVVEMGELDFTREPCPTTGFYELIVSPRSKAR